MTLIIKPNINGTSTPNKYSGFDQTLIDLYAEYEGYQKTIASLTAELDALNAEAGAEPVRENYAMGDSPYDMVSIEGQTAYQEAYASWQGKLQAATSKQKELTTQQNLLPHIETQITNRESAISQEGVNTEAAAAGETAKTSENLLMQNVQQEVQGLIAVNNQQASDASKSVDEAAKSKLGQYAAKAGQAGYLFDPASGTGGALAKANSEESAATKESIQAYQEGYNNLLTGKSSSAQESATTLNAAIDKSVSDWTTYSTEAVTSATGNLLTNVDSIVGLETQYDATGLLVSDPYADSGVLDSQEAVETVLDTWSLDEYNSALDTLTSNSANKQTWDQMLLDREAGETNPYDIYGTPEAESSSMTPKATPTNAAAAASDTTETNLLTGADTDTTSNVYTSPMMLSSKKKTGRLI